MKSVLILMCTLLCVLFAVVPGFGQSGTASQKPFSLDEEAKIKEGVKAVLTYIQTQQNIDSTAVARGAISIPDVVDKALDKFGGAVTIVYENVKKAAPLVWEVMLFQQYVKAFNGLLGPILWIILIYWFYKFINRQWKPDADEIWNNKFETKTAGFWFREFFTKILPISSGVIACWVLFANAKTSMLLFINPQYYAMRDLLILLLGSSHGM